MAYRIALILALFLLFAAAVSLAAAWPLVLFTDNVDAMGTDPAATDMEQVLLERIEGATSTIDVAIYDFNRASVRDALIAAHGRGVVVRVVTDDDSYEDPSYHPFYAALEAAGIGVVNDGRSSIMHNKFFVIDGEMVWTGSTNITDRGFTLNHNNSTVMTSTLLANIYEIEFEEMFVDGLFGTAKADNVTHTIDYNGIPVEIYFSPSDEAMAEVVAEVNAAEESLYFSIFYFTDDDLRDALIARSQAGVEIMGVWDKSAAANRYSEHEALCQAGIPIKIENFPGLMHNKFMVIDPNGPSPRVITGSMNWTTAGDEENDENTLIMHDGVTAMAYAVGFWELYDALGEETLCEVEVYLPAVIAG